MTVVKFQVETPRLSLPPLQPKDLLGSCKFNKQHPSAGYAASSSALADLAPERSHGHPGNTEPRELQGRVLSGIRP